LSYVPARLSNVFIHRMSPTRLPQWKVSEKKNVSELREEPDESLELEVLANRRNNELRAPTDHEVLNAR
jgi:hypothetical protein